MIDETGFGAARRNPTRLLFPIVAYSAAAAIATWPLVLHPRALLGAPVGVGDPYLNLWILGWGMQAVLFNPASIFTGKVFDANIFYPATGTLAYSDHLLLQSVLLAPLYAVTGDVVLCYNVLLVASLVASAMAMHIFARAVVGFEPAAYLAGLAWGFGSYHFAHLIHLQLQSLYFLPLTFLFLHRVLAGRRARDAVFLGITAALQAWSSIYYGIIGGLALVVAGIGLAVGVGRWRSVAVWRRLASAAIVAAVLVLPMAIVYERVARREGFGRNLYQAARSAASMSSYVQAPLGNVVYGRSGLLRHRDTGPEGELFPGFVLIALAILGGWRGWRRDAAPTVLAMTALAVFGFVMSLGPEGARVVYATLHRFIFGFSAIRAPARFSILVMFGLSVLGAIGFRELLAPRRARSSFVLFAAFAAELLHVPTHLAAAPSRGTGVGQWLAREPGGGAVAVLPIGTDIDATPAMVQSIEHRRSIVNGYSGQRPSFYGPLADAINTFPGPDAVTALHDAGVRFVVVPQPLATAEPPLVERARLTDGAIYELVWTPELETRLVATSTVAPPLPGRIPFRVGELARYRVDWGGAGVNLSAGDISIGVEAPPYRFVVRAETAPWVARFFEARDVFVTQADTMVFPQTHEREQNEGSRHLTRAFVFDPQAHVVRTGRTIDEARSDGAVVLPMSHGARDAIAALFYVRTLELAAGAHVSFPVNEAGRNVRVDLDVQPVERIQVLGREIEAIRLSPTITRRAADGQPLTSTIWLSNDLQRIPLILDIDAGFGHVRVELVSYDP